MKLSQPKWVITIGKKEIVLNAEEFELVKQAALHGKTMVWLPDIVISIPHIMYMEKEKKPQEARRSLPERALTHEEMTDRIQKLKSNLFNKHESKN